MKEIVCKIANLYVKINYQYDLIYRLCKDYIINDYDHIDIDIDDFDVEEYLKENKPDVSETLAILEALAIKIVAYDKLLVHGAAIEYRNKAYLFMAPSGTGKSTHIKYWKQVLSDVHIINGDKPIIDIDGYLHGTPWNGKEGWGKPVSYKLDSLVLIVRDTYNHIERVNNKDCLLDILNGAYLSSNKQSALKLLDKIFKDIPIYKMYCIDDISSAKLCIEEVVR